MAGGLKRVIPPDAHPHRWPPHNGSSLNNAGSNGNYWSSTPNSNANNAYNLNFNSGNHNVNNNNRNYGFSVRPVCP